MTKLLKCTVDENLEFKVELRDIKELIVTTNRISNTEDMAVSRARTRGEETVVVAYSEGYELQKDEVFFMPPDPAYIIVPVYSLGEVEIVISRTDIVNYRKLPDYFIKDIENLIREECNSKGIELGGVSTLRDTITVVELIEVLLRYPTNKKMLLFKTPNEEKKYLKYLESPTSFVPTTFVGVMIEKPAFSMEDYRKLIDEGLIVNSFMSDGVSKFFDYLKSIYKINDYNKAFILLLFNIKKSVHVYQGDIKRALGEAEGYEVERDLNTMLHIRSYKEDYSDNMRLSLNKYDLTIEEIMKETVVLFKEVVPIMEAVKNYPFLQDRIKIDGSVY
jgi:hypothetical protein